MVNSFRLLFPLAGARLITREGTEDVEETKKSVSEVCASVEPDSTFFSVAEDGSAACSTEESASASCVTVNDDV